MQLLVGIVFVVFAVILAGIFLTVARQATIAPYEEVSRRAGLLRRWWFRGLLVVAVVVFLVSMTWLPYQFVRAGQVSGDARQIAVTARQFNFEMPQCVPSGTAVEV